MLVEMLVIAVVFLILAKVMPGIKVSGFLNAILAAVTLIIANAVIAPVLLLVTLPINILTLGLFTIVISMVVLMLVSAVVPGFSITKWRYAFVTVLVLAAVRMLIS